MTKAHVPLQLPTSSSSKIVLDSSKPDMQQGCLDRPIKHNTMENPNPKVLLTVGSQHQLLLPTGPLLLSHVIS